MISLICLYRSSLDADPWLAIMALSVRVGEVTLSDADCLKRLFPETDLSLEVSLALLVTDAG